jgi:Flp pilus assembly protein TadG
VNLRVNRHKWNRNQFHRYARGTVTAEFAVILPLVALLAGLLLCSGSAVITRMDCQDAVSQGARYLGAAEDSPQRRAEIEKTVLAHAPSGSSLTFTSVKPGIQLTLTCPIHAGALRLMPLHVQQSAIGIPYGKEG